MIAQTITAIALLIGSLLGISSHLYRGIDDDKD
jgi:ABC-type dipeptide/oligopeptide/nickel transport system permease subunit